MKIRSAGLAVVILSLVAFGIGNALTPFSGVINPNTDATVVDTAILNVLTATDTFLTTGWNASGTTLDTFQFPDLSAWPSKVTLIGTIKGTPNTSVFTAPLPDTWYRFQYGSPVAPLVEFISPGQGLEESGSPRELLPRLSVSPTVVTSQMAISVRPVGSSRPVVEVLDAAGNLVRSLTCTSGANGLATTVWNRDDGQGRLVARGVYFCRYDAPGAVAVRKVLVAH